MFGVVNRLSKSGLRGGIAVVGLAFLLAGCAGSGPSGRELLSAASRENSSFALVEINDDTLRVVSRWHRPALGAMFGDYRAPRVQRINAGDSVQITIWEAGSGGIFTTPAVDRAVPGSRGTVIPEQVVAKEGSITVPYAGRVNVAGKTTQQVEELIVQRLQGKATEPQALVTLTRNISNSVTVTGEVTQGARVPLSTRGDRILDVVALAGGVRAPVHEAFISITRDGTTLTVPMQTLLAQPTENVYLRPGDVVTVVRAPQSFTAVGATGRQAVVPFDAGGLTLEEAVGRAGGLIDDRADPTAVFVLRYELVAVAKEYASVPPHLLGAAVVPVAYNLDMRNPASLFKARLFAMRDKDILYVSNAPLTEVEKILRLFTSVAVPVATAASVKTLAE